jgi:aminopeptidase N
MLSYRTPAFATEPLMVWGAPPPGTVHAPRERVYDLQHQVARVRFDWERHAVVGSTTLRIAALEQALPSIAIDAVDMTIGRVAGAGGRTLRHDYDGRTLTVHLPAPLAAGARTTFTVDYETVRPKKGAYFIDRRHVVWTQGETEDTRYWVPTYDFPNDKTTWEFHIRVPRSEKALSNGRLAGTRRVGGDTEWHWIQDKPASTYLMAAVTGDYVVLQDTWRRTTPVGYWTYADSVEATWRGMGKTPRMMELFSTTLGIDYPWAKYDLANAPDYIFGGMENVTATIQADDAILHPAWADPHARTEQLVAHELAHQWFGDLLTTRDWANVWLNEGFARFLEQYWMEIEHAPDGGPWHRLQTHEQAIAADRAARRPLVYGVWESDPLEVFFSGHIYPKGAAVLQMLRRQMGDSTFWRAMHRYATKHAYQNVETADFQRAMEEATGRSLTTFFRQWVFGAGVPAFRVSHAYDSAARELRLVATQVQPRDSLTGFFEADVDVEVLTDSGAERAVIAVRGETSEARIPLRAAPRSIRWDKGNWLLDVADFPRPTVMLAHQLAHDDDVAGRIEAIDLLARRHGEVIAARALAAAVREERFAPARARALAGLGALALGQPGAPEIAVMPLRAIATAAALHARDDADPRVRQEVPAVMGAVSRQALGEHIGRLLADSSLFVRGAAIQAYAAAFPAEALDSIRAMLEQESWIDITRTRAVTALGSIRTPEAWALLLRYLDAGTRRETRQAAIAALIGQAAGREAELAAALVPLLDADDLFIRRDAARSLGALGQATSAAALEGRRRVEAEGRVISAIDAALATLRGGS